MISHTMTPFIDIKGALAAADNDPSLLHALIEIYFGQLPSLLTEIQSGVECRQAEKLERNAHSLKGAISVFGRHPARDLASNLERQGRESDWAAATASWGQLQAQLDSLAVQLRDLQRQLEAGLPET
jgi:HPt (histidine-containing phosphotransfer) domain-containing protein